MTIFYLLQRYGQCPICSSHPADTELEGAAHLSVNEADPRSTRYKEKRQCKRCNAEWWEEFNYSGKRIIP